MNEIIKCFECGSVENVYIDGLLCDKCKKITSPVEGKTKKDYLSKEAKGMVKEIRNYLQFNKDDTDERIIDFCIRATYMRMLQVKNGNNA